MTEKRQETIQLETTNRVCPVCERYAAAHSTKPVVVMSCEGACLRGEVARRAANMLCHRLAPERTVRLCLGGAFTKEGGQRGLARNATRAVAIEGCFLECASRMMKAVVPGLSPDVVVADKLYHLDGALFGIDEMSDEEIQRRAEVVAYKVLASL